MSRMSEKTALKIFLAVILVFFFIWLIVERDNEEKRLFQEYQEGYEEGYGNGYAAALSDYGIEQ